MPFILNPGIFILEACQTLIRVSQQTTSEILESRISELCIYVLGIEDGTWTTKQLGFMDNYIGATTLNGAFLISSDVVDLITRTIVECTIKNSLYQLDLLPFLIISILKYNRTDTWTTLTVKLTEAGFETFVVLLEALFDAKHVLTSFEYPSDPVFDKDRSNQQPLTPMEVLNIIRTSLSAATFIRASPGFGFLAPDTQKTNRTILDATWDLYELLGNPPSERTKLVSKSQGPRLPSYEHNFKDVFIEIAARVYLRIKDVKPEPAVSGFYARLQKLTEVPLPLPKTPIDMDSHKQALMCHILNQYAHLYCTTIHKLKSDAICIIQLLIGTVFTVKDAAEEPKPLLPFFVKMICLEIMATDDFRNPIWGIQLTNNHVKHVTTVLTHLDPLMRLRTEGPLVDKEGAPTRLVPNFVWDSVFQTLGQSKIKFPKEHTCTHLMAILLIVACNTNEDWLHTLNSTSRTESEMAAATVCLTFLENMQLAGVPQNTLRLYTRKLESARKFTSLFVKDAHKDSPTEEKPTTQRLHDRPVRRALDLV